MLLSLQLALLATVTSAAVVPLPPQPLAAVALDLNPRNPSLTDRPIPFLPRHGDDEHDEPSHAEIVVSDDHAPSGASAAGDDLILEPLPSSTHGHSHHHGATPPLMILNETDILLTHQPNPLSYWTHDYVLEPGDDRLGGRGQWGGWILWGHAVGMTVALVPIFPLAHALRTTPFSIPILLIVSLLTSIGLLCSAVYNARTPDLYAHDSHGPLGWVLVTLFGAVGGWDVYKALRGVEGGGWRAKVWRLLGVEDQTTASTGGYGRVGTDEQVGLHTIEEDEEEESIEKALGAEEEVVVLFPPSSSEALSRSHTFGPLDTSRPDVLDDDDSPRSSSSTLRHQHDGPASPMRDRLGVHGAGSGHLEQTVSQRLSVVALVLAWTLVPVLGVASFLSGITVYAGACRAEYISGCLAHLIKGAIFFFYGLATFARYLGAWADFGWSWNVRPESVQVRRRHSSGDARNKGAVQDAGSSVGKQRWRVPTAEATESLVIFLYGLTNTWMERFGAEPGSPYTIHQVQHISIALLFFFGGALGLAVESSMARNLLSSAIAQLDRRPLRNIEKPPTWSGSFNPFPASVIGITGLVMSAHHQKYMFAVQVHALWGNFLALFAAFRIATYVFLWLRPPRSILPSRPPTEALAAFCVTGGGISFILSNEQVVYGAMRSGWDDVMTFLALAVSSTYFLFGWLFLVLVARGWAKQRNHVRRTRGTWSNASDESRSSSPLHGVGGRV